jgi:uncharacterized membrane protein YcjF (UPF0283 family)
VVALVRSEDPDMNPQLKAAQAILTRLGRRSITMAYPILLVLSFLIADWFLRAQALIYSAITAAAVGLAAWVRFVIRDPDRLQSEDYQLRKKGLDIVADQGRRKNLRTVCLEEAMGKIMPQHFPAGESPRASTTPKSPA